MERRERWEVSEAQYVILPVYKPDSGPVNGDQDVKHAPLTGLSPGRRVGDIQPTAFASEVVTMIVHRHEIRLNGEGRCALFSSSSLTNPARLFSRNDLGFVSPRTLFRCDMSHIYASPIWQAGLLCPTVTTPLISSWVSDSAPFCLEHCWYSPRANGTYSGSPATGSRVGTASDQ